MKCGGKRYTHEIFRVVSRFPRNISCSIAENLLCLGQYSFGGLKTNLYSVFLAASGFEPYDCTASAPPPKEKHQILFSYISTATQTYQKETKIF